MGPAGELIDATQRGELERVRAILAADRGLVNFRDESGATALHYAALHGQREIARLLLDKGADINSTDGQFGATPAGWAIEYLREKGGHLAIELDDLAFAIRLGDARWVSRFLQRFPALRHASSTEGIPFRKLAQDSGNPGIAALFEL